MTSTEHRAGELAEALAALRIAAANATGLPLRSSSSYELAAALNAKEHGTMRFTSPDIRFELTQNPDGDITATSATTGRKIAIAVAPTDGPEWTIYRLYPARVEAARDKHAALDTLVRAAVATLNTSQEPSA